MQWHIDQNPADDGEAWEWTLVNARRVHHVRVLKPQAPTSDLPEEARDRLSRSIAAMGRDLVEAHLDDHEPPSVISYVSGWDFQWGQATISEMGYRDMRSVRGLLMLMAHRLHLPHWLQPKP